MTRESRVHGWNRSRRPSACHGCGTRRCRTPRAWCARTSRRPFRASCDRTSRCSSHAYARTTSRRPRILTRTCCANCDRKGCAIHRSLTTNGKVPSGSSAPWPCLCRGRSRPRTDAVLLEDKPVITPSRMRDFVSLSFSSESTKQLVLMLYRAPVEWEFK
jgi:hypothetical protein